MAGNGGGAVQRAPIIRRSNTERPTALAAYAMVETVGEATTWLKKEGIIEDDDAPGNKRIALLIINAWLATYDTVIPHTAKNSIQALKLFLIEGERLEEEKARERGIEKEKVENIVEEAVGRAVEKAVEGCMEECREVLGSLAEATMKTVKELGERVQEAVGELEEGQIAERGGQGRSRADMGGTAHAAGERPATRGGAMGGGKTYAEIARQVEHEEVMARTEVRGRQVLVDGPEGSNEMKGLSELELLAKAKMAKDNMGIGGMDAPPDTTFVSVRKLRNGGALYEMNSPEAAAWLSQPDVRKLFLEKYGAGAIVKDKTFPIIAEFVPTTLGDDPSKSTLRIEDDNHLHPGEVLEARWVKAPQTRRDPNQRVAHLILACATPEGANHIIDRGIVVEGKHVRARRLQNDPRRCMKCQQLGKGHYAAECKQQETCGTCAMAHRTRECKETDPTKFKCVNCRARGWRHDHPSSARTCPVFIEAKERLTARTPELGYKYYPTTDPKTWIRTDEQRSNNNILQRANTNNGRGMGRLAGGAPGAGGGGGGGAMRREEAAAELEGTAGGSKDRGTHGGSQTRISDFLLTGGSNGQGNGRERQQSTAWDDDEEWERMTREAEERTRALREELRKLEERVKESAGVEHALSQGRK